MTTATLERLNTFTDSGNVITTLMGKPYKGLAEEQCEYIQEETVNNLLSLMEKNITQLNTWKDSMYGVLYELEACDEQVDSDEGLADTIASLSSSADAVTSLIGFVQIAADYVEASPVLQPYSVRLVRNNRNAIRAMAGVRNALLALVDELKQRLPAKTRPEPAPMTEKEAEEMINYSHKMWGLPPKNWGQEK
ncbi:TPA: hypothetical protein JFB58_003877 [Escherichia coli]|nr:hypothetical protein [Escherichia coli]